MLNKMRTPFSVCVFLFGMTAFLMAAGSYLETDDGLYDIGISTQGVSGNFSNKLTIGKQVFAGSTGAGRIYGGGYQIHTPTVYNTMSTDSQQNFIYKTESGYYTSAVNEQRYEMKKPWRATSERLLPGFPALSETMGQIQSAYVFDIYPGTANIINNKDLKISFKVYAQVTTSSAGAVSYDPPYMDLSKLHVEINENAPNNKGSGVVTVFESNNFAGGSLQLNTTQNGQKWDAYITQHNDGLVYGFDFIYKDAEMAAGTIMTLTIEVPFAGGDVENPFRRSYTYVVEGVPFLERIVSGNTEYGLANGEILNSQLYGWTAAGGGDINGDGFPDLVVGDPYYKYDNSTLDYKRSGRVYVYFGGPDKVLDLARALPTPDLYIDNSFATGNSAKSRDREFGFKVKLADINNDGLADIIIGQPSYSTDEKNVNHGRILIYYGGRQLKDGALAMDVNGNQLVKPSIILNVDSSIESVGDPYTDPLFGAIFDTGDINGDGYADIVAKIGNNSDYTENRIYLISGADISAGTNVELSRQTKTVEIGGPNKTGIFAKNNSEVAVIGDMNGDGISDFAVSYPQEDGGLASEYSNVRVFFGEKVKVLTGYGYLTFGAAFRDHSANNDYFGMSLAGGDINHDGYADLVVGKLTTAADEKAGKVLVLLGRGGLSGVYIYNGDDPDQTDDGIIAINEPFPANSSAALGITKTVSQFGLRVAVADVNNDSYDDILIGAPYYGESEIGAVYLVMGTGIDATQEIQADHLSRYVITGHNANAHYGMTIVNLGDFDQNGYNDVLIGAPGFYGDSLFRGYPLASGDKNMMEEHHIDIFSNKYGIDNALPGILWSKTNPQDDETAWDEKINTINLILFDRGKAGLEFGSIQVELRDPAVDRVVDTLLNSAERLGGSSISVLGNNFELSGFWLSSGNYNEAGVSKYHVNGTDGTAKIKEYFGSNSPYNARLDESFAGGMFLYRYKQTPRFIGLEFTLKSGKQVFADSKDYQMLIQVSDRGGLAEIHKYDLDRKTRVTLNMSTNEPLLDSKEYSVTGNPAITFAKTGTLTKIGDMNYDGFEDFVLAYPNWNTTSSQDEFAKYNGKVTIFFGSALPDFTGLYNVTNVFGLNQTPGERGTLSMNFGVSVASAKLDMGGNLVNTLLIGYNKGFYVIEAESKLSNQEIKTDKLETSKFLMDGIPEDNPEPYYVGRIAVLSNPDPAKGDYIAVMNNAGTKYKIVVKDAGGSWVSSREWINIGTATANNVNDSVQMIAANIIKNSGLDPDYPELIFGVPSENKVFVHKLVSENDGLLHDKDTIELYSSDKISFGHSLAAGYFVTQLNKDGAPERPAELNALQSLAIGAPEAKINQTDRGTGFVMVIPGGKLPTSGGNSQNIDSLNVNADYYLRFGEKTNDNFGYSLTALKYMATPEHLASYEADDGKEYYDDYDDLAVGAQNFRSETTANGKVYIYRGGEVFPTSATTAFSLHNGRKALGSALANLGDIQNLGVDFLAISSEYKLDFLRTVHKLDTEPPLVVSMYPENNQYEVALQTSISFTVEDISGIDSSKLTITRVINGEDIPIVNYGRIVQGMKARNGGQDFTLKIEDMTVSSNNLITDFSKMPERVRYTLGLGNSEWKPSEVIELKIVVGDGRLIFVKGNDGVVRREPSSKMKEFSYGFITKFDANEEVKSRLLTGDTTNTYFGSSLAYVGDVNKDGYPDFVVGEYGNNDYGWMSGKAYLYLGDKDIDKMSQPAAVFSLALGNYSTSFDGNSAKFGWRVAPAGDLNGDGYDDVAVMAVNSSTFGGEVFVLFGSPDPRQVGRAGLAYERERIYLPAPAPKSFAWDNDYISFHALSIRAAANGSGPDGLGYGLQGGGDLNGDGYDDLIIGAPYHDDIDRNGQLRKAAGRAYVLYGGDGLIDAYARKSYQFSTVSYVGPLMLNNADAGYNAAGSDSSAFAKKAFPIGYIPNPEPEDNALFGWNILTGLNINGDTFPRTKTFNGIDETTTIQISDLLISAPGADRQTGKVYFYAGKKPASQQTDVYGVEQRFMLSGERAGDKFGYSMAALGDISADDNKGYGPKASSLIGDDFVIGAPGHGGPTSDVGLKGSAGAVYLYISQPLGAGQDFNITRNMIVYGQHSGDQFGYTVANVGNIDNDPLGNNDFIVGAPYYDEIIRVNSSTGQPVTVSVTANVGRVYAFGTSLENIGSAENPDYKLKTSIYPTMVATGQQTNEFFGAAISNLGDIDQDFSPEYLVGAPGFDNGSGNNVREASNVGRVYFYTNPDLKSPLVFGGHMDTVYSWPIPGSISVNLFTIVPNDSGPRRIDYNVPMRFRIFDDRAVKLDSTLVELIPEGKKHISRYTFVPSQTGRKYYTYVNRKNVDFFLNLGEDLYYNTTYNVRIYATDQRGNALDYAYLPTHDIDTYDPFGKGERVTRVPWPLADLPLSYRTPTHTDYTNNEKYYKQYFEYFFTTGANPTGKPEPNEFYLNKLVTENINVNQLSTGEYEDATTNVTATENEKYFKNRAVLHLELKQGSDSDLSSYNITTIPQNVLSSNTIIFNVTQNVSANNQTSIIFNNGENNPTEDGKITINMTEDGIFTIGVWASDKDNNAMTQPRLRTFIHDADPPKIVTGVFSSTDASGNTVVTSYLPAANTTRNPDDCQINFAIVDNGAGLDVVTTGNQIDLDRFQIYLSVGATTNYSNLDATITVDITDVSGNPAVGTRNFWQQVTGDNLAVSASHMEYPDGTNSAKPTTLSVGIKNQKFAYENLVNILVKVTDNAGHPATATYSYQVSPDYRPPQVTYGQPPVINQGEYTVGPLTISLNAYDDVLVYKLVFAVEEDDPSNGKDTKLTTANITPARLITVPVTMSMRADGVFLNINGVTETSWISAVVTKDYSGQMEIIITGNGSPSWNTPADGLRHILVAFEDQQGNRSEWTTCSIILDADSETGGPVMPTVRVNYRAPVSPTANADVRGLNIPHPEHMPLYFNKDTGLVDLYVYAKDTIISPNAKDIPSEWEFMGDDNTNGRPLGVVVSVYVEDNGGGQIWQPRDLTDQSQKATSDILLDYRSLPLARDINHGKSMMRKIDSFNLSDYVQNDTLGDILHLYVNFADNDALLPQSFLDDFVDSGNPARTWSDYLLRETNASNQIVNARYPTVSYFNRYENPYGYQGIDHLYSYHPLHDLTGEVTVDYKGDPTYHYAVIASANAAPGAAQRVSTNTSNIYSNYSERPAHLTLYYDNTPPELTDLEALGGTTGGSPYNAHSYSQNRGSLRVAAKYKDTISTNLTVRPLAVHELYYQILMVTANGEDTLVWVDTKGQSTFEDRQYLDDKTNRGKEYGRNGLYLSYDSTTLNAGQWLYIASPTSNKINKDPDGSILGGSLYEYFDSTKSQWYDIDDYDAWRVNPSNNAFMLTNPVSPRQRTNLNKIELDKLEAAREKATLTIKDGDGQDVTVSAKEFAVEDLVARSIVSTNLNLWSVLDVSGISGERLDEWVRLPDVEIPVSLNPGMMYFLRMAARDQAGNFSKISISNPVYVDTGIPRQPSYNYEDGIVLNRNRFNIDFMDDYAGIYNLRFSDGNDIDWIYLANAPVDNNTLREWRYITVTDDRKEGITNNRTYDYKQQVLDNWKVSDTFWSDKLPENDKTGFRFFIDDAVGWSYSTGAKDETPFYFIKDTTAPTFAPTLSSSPNGVIALDGHYYTQDDTLLVNMKPLEPHFIAVTDLAHDWVVATSNTEPSDPRRIDPSRNYSDTQSFANEYFAHDDLRHIQDFSFEWEGDHEISKPWYVHLAPAAERTYKTNGNSAATKETKLVDDTRSTINIAFLSAAADAAKDDDLSMFTQKSVMGANGHYALAVQFDVDHLKDHYLSGGYDIWEEYTWGGVFATFNAGVDNARLGVDSTFNYTIGVLLNADKVRAADTQPNYLIGDFDYKHEYYGYFGLVIEAGGQRKVADQKVQRNKGDDQSEWNNWKLLTANVVMPREYPDKTVTISIRHLNAYDDKTTANGGQTDMPYVMKLNSSTQLHGTLLIDALYVVPGLNVTPHIVASSNQNANGYDFDLRTEQKLNSYTILAYDKVGNLATQNIEALSDSTPPTWSVWGDLSDWEDDEDYRVITTYEGSLKKGSEDEYPMSTGKRAIAYYLSPPRNGQGGYYEIARNPLETQGLLVVTTSIDAQGNSTLTANYEYLEKGRLYSNAIELVNGANGEGSNGGRIAGLFRAQEDDNMPIRMYYYDIRRAMVTTNTIDPGVAGAWEYNKTVDNSYLLPENRDRVSGRMYPAKLDAFAAGIESGGSYKVSVYAENLFGVTSDRIETEPIWYDITPPLVSVDVAPSEVETLNATVTQDSGWYRESITVTVTAVDVLWADTSLIPGGVGVEKISVVTNNGQEMMILVDKYEESTKEYLSEEQASLNSRSLTKNITFKLTAEGANSFKVRAIDRFGRSSAWVSQNFRLNIDRNPPQLEITHGKVVEELDNIQPGDWSNAAQDIGFSIEYSDGKGVGTKLLRWSINGKSLNGKEDYDTFWLNDEGYGLPSTIYYYPRVGESGTLNIREGVVAGLVPKTQLASLTDTERRQLVDNGILNETGASSYSNYYEWNNTNKINGDFFTERELLEKLKKINFGDPQRQQIVIDAWRYFTIESDIQTFYYYDQNEQITKSVQEDEANFKRKMFRQILDDKQFTLSEDGYHFVSMNVVDKFDRASEVKTFGWVLKDTGLPDIQIDLGGSFQSEWYVGGEDDDSTGPLNELTNETMEKKGLVIKAQVGDLFSNKVLVTRSYYPAEYAAGVISPTGNNNFYDNITALTPGSGVQQVTIWIGENKIDRVINPAERLYTRFGFSLNKYDESLGIKDNIPVSDFIITANGINTIKYQVWDFAGNTQVPQPPTPNNDTDERHWNDVLRSYVYPYDINVIRGIKVDTRPPKNVELQIVTRAIQTDSGKVENAYTDTLQDEPGYYPLYTNKRQIPVRFSGEDEGIGVRYAYFSATENAVSYSMGVTYSSETNDQFVQTDAWSDIAKIVINGTEAEARFWGAPKPKSAEQFILNYANYRIVNLGATQGTRNLTLRMADDFGMNYFVSRSSIEEISATFDPKALDFATANYISASVLKRGLYINDAQTPTAGYEVKKNGNGDFYFISGGLLDVPTANRAKGKDQPHGYTITTTTIDAGVDADGNKIINDLTVYLWDKEIEGREDHRSATVTADRLIVYDNQVFASAAMPVTLPIKELRYEDGSGVTSNLWTSLRELTVEYVHDETEELSGITHIMFGGDIVSVRPATDNPSVTTSYEPGEWVPYAYRSAGTTNNYIVTLKNPLSQGPRKVSITGVLDRAGNSVTSSDMHFVEFYYDVGMPRDAKGEYEVEGRYFVKNQHGAVLNGKYYVGVPTYNLELNFNGAAHYDVLEYSDDLGHNSLVSGNYDTGLDRLADKPDFWKGINDIAMVLNRADGPKSLVLRLFDRGTQDMTEVNMLTITYNHWVDNTPPTLNIVGLQDKDTQWYTPKVAFNLNVADDGAGIASVVYQIQNDYTGTRDTATRNYTFNSDERYPKAASLNYIEVTRRGNNNQVNIRVEDGVGNIAIHQVSGIRVNDVPPAIKIVTPLQGTLSGNMIYTNQKVTPLQILGEGIDSLNFTVDYQRNDTLERYTSRGDKNKASTYNVTIEEHDSHTYDGVRTLNILAYDDLYTKFSGDNPLFATTSYTVLLDRVAPSFSVESGPAARVSIVDDSKVITGRIEEESIGYGVSPVQVFYQINNTGSQVWPAQVSGDVWTIYVRDVIEQSGRNNGSYNLRIYAQDLAGNRSSVSDNNIDGEYRAAAFSVPDGYIMAPRGMVIRGLDVGTTANVNDQQQAMQMASSKLGGVKYAPELDATSLPIVQEEPDAQPTGNIVLTYSEEAEERVNGKTDTFRIFYLDPVKNEWVLVPGQEAKETNGITAHDKEKRMLSAPLIGFGMYRIFDTTTFADDLKEVHMFPNPYKGSDGDLANGEDGVADRDRIVIENITETTRAKVYTISGELVTKLEDPNPATHSLEWDLTNSRGARVASGIYIILLTDEEGHRFIGRLTVVR